MHALLCNVARTGDICNDASCIASGMHTKSFPGNFRGLGSMTSVWAVDLNLHVSIPYLQAPEAQVHHSQHFSKPLFGSVHASNGSGEHHSSGTMLLVSQCWRTVHVLLHQPSLFCVHHIQTQTNFSDDRMVSSVRSPIPKLLSNWWCSMNTFHEDLLVWFFKVGRGVASG